MPGKEFGPHPEGFGSGASGVTAAQALNDEALIGGREEGRG